MAPVQQSGHSTSVCHWPYAFGHCTNCRKLIIGWSFYLWSVLVREPCPRCGKPW